ncbi:MAG: hypothetical protein OEY67_11245, partial [Gammaproteobacteria bacterium]|nr:hypothetical protein [Gammaproteobacteria bacterium]
MKLHLEKGSRNQNLIDAYTSGRITVNQAHYTGSLILAPDQLDNQWPPKSFSGLEPGHLSRLLEFDPEIILIG